MDFDSGSFFLEEFHPKLGDASSGHRLQAPREGAGVLQDHLRLEAGCIVKLPGRIHSVSARVCNMQSQGEAGSLNRPDDF